MGNSICTTSAEELHNVPVVTLPVDPSAPDECSDEVMALAERACTTAADILSKARHGEEPAASLLQMRRARTRTDLEHILVAHEQRVLESVEQALARFFQINPNGEKKPSTAEKTSTFGWPLTGTAGTGESAETEINASPASQPNPSSRPFSNPDVAFEKPTPNFGPKGNAPNDKPAVPKLPKLSTPDTLPTLPPPLENVPTEDGAKSGIVEAVIVEEPKKIVEEPKTVATNGPETPEKLRPVQDVALNSREMPDDHASQRVSIPLPGDRRKTRQSQFGNVALNPSRISQMEAKRRISALIKSRSKDAVLDDITISAESRRRVFDKAGDIVDTKLCAKLVHDGRFENFITVMIIMNSALIGITMDYTATYGREKELPTSYKAAEIFFTILFTLELLLRFIAEGPRMYVLKETRKWAVMDTVIVCSALIEQAFLIHEKHTGESASANLNIFAALRILRLVRVARSVRLMQFSRDLRALVMGIVNCMKPLLWSMVFLILITFIFTVIIIEFSLDKFTFYNATASNSTLDDSSEAAEAFPRLLSSSCRELMATGYDEDKDVAGHIGASEELQYHFGHLPRGMYTLFKAISGGQNWGEFAEPLKHISWFMQIFFCFYIGVVIFAVLNIVTSIFIENARKNAERDKDNMIWEEIQECNWRKESLKSIFVKADLDSTGSLSWDEFRDHFEDPIVQAFVRTLGIDVESFELKTLFDLFDIEGTGQIDLETFVAGCTHLRGNATTLDLTLLRQQSLELRNSFATMSKMVCDKINDLSMHCNGGFHPRSTS